MLLNESEVLTERIKGTKNTQDNKEEVEALDALSTSIRVIGTSFQTLVGATRLLRKNKVPLLFSDQKNLVEVLKTVKQITSDFDTSPISVTLKKGNKWHNLEKKLNPLTTQLNSTVHNSWKEYAQKIYFGGPRPSELDTRLALTPKNKELLVEYRALYDEFDNYRNNLPKSESDFKKIKDLSEALKKFNFEEEVSPEVKDFYDAITEGCASLTLLTPEVMEWLKTNNLLIGYEVRIK